MLQHLTWYAILWAASLVAVISTWLVGPIGLLMAAALSLTVGLAVPNDFLFKKPPDSIHHKSGFKFYRNEAIFGFVILGLILSGTAIGIFVWTDSPENLAVEIKNWPIPSSLIGKSAPTIEILAQPETYVFSASEYRQEYMHRYFPRVSLWAIIMRPITYVFISLSLVLFTFDRVRSDRTSTNFSTAKRPSFKIFMTALCFGVSLVWMADMFSASPYLVAFNSRTFDEVAVVFSIVSLCIGLLALVGAITSVASKLISNQSYDLNPALD